MQVRPGLEIPMTGINKVDNVIFAGPENTSRIISACKLGIADSPMRNPFRQKPVQKGPGFGEASCHEGDHGDLEEGFAGGGGAFMVFGKSTVATQPGEGPFGDPPQGSPG